MEGKEIDIETSGDDLVKQSLLESGHAVTDVRSKVKVDMSALNGLRGICCVWIMVFHCIIFSKLQWDIEGSSIMPLFLMLSGFTLAVVYGKEKPTPPGQEGGTAAVKSENESKDTEEEDILPRWPFYRNRFARVGPLYYLTMLIAIPYTLAGFGVCNPKDTFGWITVVNIVPVSTLVSFVAGAPYDGPAWTVATLIVFWCFFPDALKGAKKLTNQQLVNRICWYYYAQLVLLLVSFIVVSMYANWWYAFGTATMNPITRFPLFLMGMYAGILCQRYPKLEPGSAPGNDDSTTAAALPWPNALVSFFPPYYYTIPANNADREAKLRHVGDWRDETLNTSMALLFVTAFFSVMDSGVYVLAGALVLQALAPYAQLTVVVGLTRDNSSENRIHSFLSSPTLQYLGTISMTIYLLHFMYISYLAWIVYGHSLTFCDFLAKDSECEDWADARLIPVWGIPVVIAATMITAPLVYWGFEEPLRRLLMVQKNK